MACRTLKGFPGSAALRESVSRTRSSDELLSIVAAFEAPALGQESPRTAA